MADRIGKQFTQRQLRVGEMIKQSLSMIFIRNEAKIPNLETNNITVTEVRMSQDLKIALLTDHIPIDKITENISRDLIEKKIKTINMSMKKDFGIQRPKIAILSINPHAGDDGIIGNQDQEILIPALKELSESYLIFGPFPSDSFFGSDLYKKYDAILAIYHDQGLIPFKTIAFGNGVNFTAGLDIVRTSPDHGTGYDISGKNLADPSSLIGSFHTALSILKNRKQFEEINSNPLKVKELKSVKK